MHDPKFDNPALAADVDDDRTHVYLAGPMTGIRQFNFPAFDAAARWLREVEGLEVVSPHELDDELTRTAALASDDGAPGSGAANGETYGDFLSRDVKIVLDEADAVVVMGDYFHTPEGAPVCWLDSRGARLEVLTALLSGKDVWVLQSTGPPINDYYLRAITENERALAAPLPNVPVPEPCDCGGDCQPAADPASITEWDPKGRELELVGEEVMVEDPETGGQKGQKLSRLGAVDPLARLELSKVAGMGAIKYARYNYLKGFAWSSCVDAAYRHLMLYEAGLDRDAESDLLHVAHAAWHLLALASFQLREIGTDDRAPAEGPVVE